MLLLLQIESLIRDWVKLSNVLIENAHKYKQNAFDGWRNGPRAQEDVPRARHCSWLHSDTVPEDFLSDDSGTGNCKGQQSTIEWVVVKIFQVSKAQRISLFKQISWSKRDRLIWTMLFILECRKGDERFRLTRCRLLNDLVYPVGFRQGQELSKDE